MCEGFWKVLENLTQHRELKVDNSKMDFKQMYIYMYMCVCIVFELIDFLIDSIISCTILNTLLIFIVQVT